MKQYLGAAALAVTAALAVPAFASAHGSVYKSTANTGAALTPETRYFITNHGYSSMMRETNGVEGTKGMVAYNLIPSAWRTGKSFADVMAQGGTGVQPHATCLGAGALESEAAIRSWQGTDPFYNYVPFQTASAGLEDDPAKWLATLQGAGVTTADLATDQTRGAKCLALGGQYKPADAIATTAAALAVGQIEPLEEEIKSLKQQGTTTVAANSALSSQVASLTASLAGVQSELATAKTQIAGMLLAATPLTLTMASAKAKSVATAGAKITVKGQPLKPVTVTVSIGEAQATQLKLASSLLGRKTATTAADGTASVTVKLSKAAAKAVKALKKSVSFSVEATSGDRFTTAKGKFTR